MFLRASCLLAVWAGQAIGQPFYVGSKGCASCHAKITASYFRTGMGRAMVHANLPEQLALVRTPVTIGRFQVFRSGNDLYQSETEVDSQGNTTGHSSYKLEYAIGSGTRGFGFIVKRDNRLVEAPLSFYTKTGKWDLSPGYDGAEQGFDRFITAECVACHSGRSQPVPNRLAMYLDPPFLELAIGCENCHGPGRQHVNSAGKAPLVNPARLAPRESEAICLKCHQGNEVSADSDLLAHGASMKLSRCFDASNGKLTCITCHDPHVPVPPAARPAFFRAKCLTCHTDASCGLPKQQRGAVNDCSGCHMTKRDLPEIPHTALTNHRIGVYRP